MSKNETRGFLILAHGKPEYLKFAANLAASIKVYGDYQVAVVTEGTIIMGSRKPMLFKFFDEVIQIRYGHDKPFYLKTLINEYSPFDHTIYLDADSLCLSDPGHLFEAETDFDMHVVDTWCHGGQSDVGGTLGRHCPMTWGHLPDIWNFYGWPPLQLYPETNSSYIRWRKTPETERVFQLAEILYAEHPFPDYNWRNFAYYPDELAFNAALAYLRVAPDRGSPMFFHFKEGGLPKREDIEKHVFLSLPGISNTHAHVWKYYFKRLHKDLSKKFGWEGFKVDKKGKAGYNVTHERHVPMRAFDEERFNELIQ